MYIYRLIFILKLFLNYCDCEINVSTIFLQAFTSNSSLRVSHFNEIFPLIKHNQASFESTPNFINFTQHCKFVNSLVSQYSSGTIGIQNDTNLYSINNFLYFKFLQSPCSEVKPNVNPKRFSVVQVWIYGFLTVTIINTTALLGIIFMPLVQKKFYNSLMTFMVALAVGSLAGTAILILIPDSMRISEMAVHGNFDKNDYKWKATVVFVGIYMFFITERIFKILFMKQKGEQTPSTEDKLAAPVQSIEVPMKVAPFNGDIIPSENISTNVSKTVQPVAWMIIFGDGLHNFVDGLSIGAGFAYDVMTGISVSVAIICEELPHELGDFAVLVSSGMSFKKAMFWNTMSAMTCYVGFVIGVIVGRELSASVWIFAIAGGMFLYISLVDMMNEIISTLDKMHCTWTSKYATFALQNLGLWTGYSIILIVALHGDKIKFGV